MGIANFVFVEPAEVNNRLQELLLDSGLHCSRYVLDAPYEGLPSHIDALRHGIVPILKEYYDEWEEVEIGIPKPVDLHLSPRDVMEQLAFFYHNPVYPSERSPEEYQELVHLLFPEGHCYEGHCWSDDWCEFFEIGREWFGTACYSIYDREDALFTLFFVSDTD